MCTLYVYVSSFFGINISMYVYCSSPNETESSTSDDTEDRDAEKRSAGFETYLHVVVLNAGHER